MKYANEPRPSQTRLQNRGIELLPHLLNRGVELFPQLSKRQEIAPSMGGDNSCDGCQNAKSREVDLRLAASELPIEEQFINISTFAGSPRTVLSYVVPRKDREHATAAHVLVLKHPRQVDVDTDVNGKSDSGFKPLNKTIDILRAIRPFRGTHRPCWHIIDLLNSGNEPLRPWLTMPLVRGPSLAALMKYHAGVNINYMPRVLVYHVWLSLLDVLAWMHSSQPGKNFVISHGNLTLDHVLLEPRRRCRHVALQEGLPLVKVISFGQAECTDASKPSSASHCQNDVDKALCLLHTLAQESLKDDCEYDCDWWDAYDEGFEPYEQLKMFFQTTKATPGIVTTVADLHDMSLAWAEAGRTRHLSFESVDRVSWMCRLARPRFPTDAEVDSVCRAVSADAMDTTEQLA